MLQLERKKIADLAVVEATAKNSAVSSSAKYGIRVTAGNSSKTTVFTGTEHSHGPWNSREEAQMHMRDLERQLMYDDSFKRPSMEVVKV